MLHGKIETRTWGTKYRGWVLICASKQAYLESSLIGISGEAGCQRLLDFLNKKGIKEPKGQAIAIGRLVDCRPMTIGDEDACFVKYRHDLYCHIYKDIQAIEQFEWIGSQGWREVPTEIKNSIKLTP